MAASSLPGCSTVADFHPTPVPALSRPSPATTLSNEPGAAPRTVAIIDGLRIRADQVNTFAAEAAGSVALEEVALDTLLDREVASSATTLPANASQTELEYLVAAITADGNIASDQTGLILERLRRQRGLGPARFEALLTRNAKLRALVANSVNVTPEDLGTALEVEFGPRVRARIITVATRDLAADLRTRLTAAETETLTTFARLASQFSTDPSAASGGVVEPMSPADISLPGALRQAITDPPLGLLPEAIDTPRGWTLVYVEEKSPAQPKPTDAAVERVRTKARRRLERIAMDRLGRQLMEQAKLTVLDDAVRWSWETRPK